MESRETRLPFLVGVSQVSDNWDDDDEENKEEAEVKPEVKISEKKKIAEKIKEKERQQRKRQEEIKKRLEEPEEPKVLTPEEQLADKLRLKKLQEESDLELAKETFVEIDDLKKITNSLTVLCSEKQKQEKQSKAKKKKKGVVPGGGLKATMKDDLADYGGYDGGYVQDYEDFMEIWRANEVLDYLCTVRWHLHGKPAAASILHIAQGLHNIFNLK
ncbi:hypothetical protein A6R68_03059 [Neotoma lepida]|uniref:Uncharacterized protein n=1 Tax=Neotoma lepida TaxID=56216 RepID=A0A1A6GRW1_NEOLE|nr:hypothetical protein A6R68_03059 [Neotoma lepida]